LLSIKKTKQVEKCYHKLEDLKSEFKEVKKLKHKIVNETIQNRIKTLEATYRRLLKELGNLPKLWQITV